MTKPPVPIVVIPVIKPKESDGARSLRLALAASKRVGHTPCVAHACGVWPA